MANFGSVPMPTRSPCARIVFEWSVRSASSVVHSWPESPTYWRGSVQIGHSSGGPSRSANWVPHVTQIDIAMPRTLGRDSYGGPTRPAHPRRVRARLLVPLALLAAALFPAAARATAVGISDQGPGSFADGRLRALGLGYARLVVPYDAATSEPAQVQAWLGAV